MTGCSNLPAWPSASEVYGKAYRLLENMATNDRRGRIYGHKNMLGCCPSEDMSDLITALKEGNEERIKGLLLYCGDRGLGGEPK